MLEYIKIKCRNFLHDQKGAALEAVMIVGMISLPMFFFLIVYGQNVAQFIKTKSPNMMCEMKQWDEKKDVC
jgi:Flp pilus assembly pilin Flp